MSHRPHLVLGLLLALALASACAPPRPSASVRRPAEPPAAVIVRDVAVLDVVGGSVVGGRDVLLRDGRIEGIGRAGSVDAPPGALVVPGSGATLMPGLVDMHGHLGADPAPTWEGHHPDVDANLQAFLYGGVTTVMDPGDASPDAVDRRERIARGELLGPRVYTAGPIHTAPEGHPIGIVREFAPDWIEWYLVPRTAVALGSPAEAAEAVEARSAEGVDLVKIVIDAIPLDAPRLEREVAAALVRDARAQGLRTVAHIGTTEDAIDAAEAGVAAWVHGVYKEPIPEADVARLVAYDIPMVATIEVFERYGSTGNGPRVPTPLERELAPPDLLDAFDPVPADFDPGSLTSWLELVAGRRGVGVDNVRRLHAAGMTILAGSDAQSGVFPGAGLHRELEHLVHAGLTPAEAIRAATWDPARFLADGDEPAFGRVAEGQIADLLLVEGDPSRDVTAVSRIREVFVAGVPLERTPVPGGAE